MKVVLKHAGKWLHFPCPEKVLVAERIEDVLPMLGEAERSGLYAAGFISYEAAPAFDSALKTHSADGFPLLCLGLFRAPEVLERIEEPPGAHYEIGELDPSVSKKEFTEAIGRIKARIAEGATYQVNYTYRLSGGFSGDPWTFFYELVKGQRTEYAAYIETAEFSICSASPELFFSFSNGTITARPMKGTAPRGRTFSEDWKQARALRASEKDQAENIMIVDMIRNDIGRVAATGTVETVSRYDVEKYPTVWQMTSTVRGNLAPEISNKECRTPNNEGSSGGICGIMKALYPCASITGAPKAKTMEIIQSLETSPRKIYTGSIGFISPQGEACFNVAIRTALIQGGRLEFGIGGGIVWDSDAEAEYEETLTKARVLTQPRPDFQLLETMLWEPGSGIFLLDEHLLRVGKSAAYFDIHLNVNALCQSLERAAHTCASVRTRIRLLVSRDGATEIQTFPLDGEAQASAPAGGQRPALQVALAKEPVDSKDVFLYHKTSHRSVYESAFASAAADGKADEVILWNERGEVTEGTFTNVVISRDGKKITPPVECGLLAGTFREHLLKTGQVEEGVITVEELRSADEVYLVNSVRKWNRAEIHC